MVYAILITLVTKNVGVVGDSQIATLRPAKLPPSPQLRKLERI